MCSLSAESLHQGFPLRVVLDQAIDAPLQCDEGGCIPSGGHHAFNGLAQYLYVIEYAGVPLDEFVQVVLQDLVGPSLSVAHRRPAYRVQYCSGDPF